MASFFPKILTSVQPTLITVMSMLYVIILRRLITARVNLDTLEMEQFALVTTFFFQCDLVAVIKQNASCMVFLCFEPLFLESQQTCTLIYLIIFEFF